MAETRIISGIPELETLVGTHLGYSDWVRIDQPMVDDFARLTGDLQWIHIDVQRAAQGPFGATIVHGFFTLSLLPRFTEEVFQVEGLAMGINYGMDKVRFLAPVPVGSRVRGGSEVTSVRQSAPNTYQLGIRATIELEGSEKPAAVVEMLSLLIPADETAP